MEPCPRCHAEPPSHLPGCPADHPSSSPLESTALLTSEPGLPKLSSESPPPAGPHPLLSLPPPLPPPLQSFDGRTPALVSARAGDLAPGTGVGEYRVTELIGRGGMGTVYAGVHPVIGKRVAIKIMHPALSVDPSGIARFMREAQAVNRIGHPAVVDVFAFGQLPSGAAYLVMELLDGESLGERLRREQVPLGALREIFVQMLSGLQAAHEVGVVHRDLKPDNVMLLSRPGSPIKILDFGIAKLVDDDQPQLTRTGMALGTPAYMSPEQAMGQATGPATDIYATAVMLYLCVTGRPPFVSDSSFDVQRKHVSQLPEPPSRYVELPAELEALILRGLEKAPERRFPSARAMAEALLAVPPGELRRRDPSAISAPPMPSLSGGGASGQNPTLPDVARRHLRKLAVVVCPIEVSPAERRPLLDMLEDDLLTGLFSLAEIAYVRPPAPEELRAAGRLRGEAAARAAGADLYVEITAQVGGGDDEAPVRANLRIGNTAADEAPFSARLQGKLGDLPGLGEELLRAVERELKHRARSHTLRVQLVDDQASHPAGRALRQAEQAYSSPWDHSGVIETVLRAADLALQLDPGYPEALYRRGTARVWLAATAGPSGDGQVEGAVSDLAEACRRLPQLAAASLFHSMALCLRGRVGSALQALDRAATLEVTRTGLRSTEALVYDATLCWQRVLATVLPEDAIYADQGLPLLCLARVLCAVGRLDEAEGVLQRLLPIEEADVQATRAGNRRTMRTLPLYGPSLVLGALRLMQERPAEACDVLAEARARLSSCEHVAADLHRLIGLRLLHEASRRAGRQDKAREAQTAEAVLTRRLLGEDAEAAAVRSMRLFCFFWTPLCWTPPAAAAAAPAWRHQIQGLFLMRNGEPAAARQALEAMRARAEDETTRKDAELLLEHI